MDTIADRQNKRFFLIMLIVLLALIAVTRGLTIRRNNMIHPDELVFYSSTELLVLDWVYGEDDYEPVKPYPEATYVFRVPFQILAKLIDVEESYDRNVCLFGRISSVFYYSIGAVLGLWLVLNALGGGRAGAIIYVLTVAFSPFQIEQSRYGTFDPLSFFVLMLILVCLTQYMHQGKNSYLLFASFFVGVAAAGKYPLAYFFLWPLYFVFIKKNKKELVRLFLAISVAALAGFLLFSPSVIKSPRFILETIYREMNGYVLVGNPEGYSTVPESFFSAFVYQMFYSDLPLAAVFAVICAVRLGRGDRERTEKRFFSIVVPVTALGFLVYNCLLTTFFLRTLFPYYCVAMVYASAGLGALCRSRRARILATALCALMVIRGGYCTYIMNDEAGTRERVQALHDSVARDEITDYVWIRSFFSLNHFVDVFPEYDYQRVEIEQLFEGNFPEIEPGQMLITASLEHGWAKYCIFPPDKEQIKNVTVGWENFKEENADYFIGSIYPDYYYWLFGWWVHGSTATNIEFPSAYIYYRPN